MPYVVTQSCCADASCVVACPVNCIHPAPGEPGFATAEMLYVDPRACVDCGACATACPVDAVVPHTRLTSDQEPFRALNASYYDAFPHPDRAPLALVPAQRRLRSGRPVRVAVVGAGPAGLYVADELLRHPEVGVDVYDRLPTPYGLVRAGVAPDHPHTRAATRLFRSVEEQPGFAYRLGVEVGRDLDPEELAAAYDAVVYAVGASADRALGVPGEGLPGSLAATDLVGWYNGHPDRRDLRVPLEDGSGRAVVVGHGNVALDVARVLTADPERLAGTDVADPALAALRTSRVREVVVLGRRGPAEAAFTLPELIGLAGLDDVEVRVEGAGAITGDGPRAELLRGLADAPRRPGARRIVLRFRTAPVALVGGDRVRGIEVVRTRLEDGPAGPVAVPTGETETLAAGLVVRAVGYRGRPVAGLPYDAARGTAVHDHGRVRPGVYVAGWVKRGPTGFIGSNKADSQETVAALLDDLDAGLTGRPVTDPGALLDRLARGGVRVVDGAGWRAIDAEERRRGAAAGRPRVPLTDPAELLRVAAGASRRRRYASAR